MFVKPALLSLATVTCALTLASCGDGGKDDGAAKTTPSPAQPAAGKPKAAPKAVGKTLALVDKQKRVRIVVSGGGAKQTVLLDRRNKLASISNGGRLVYSAEGSTSKTLNDKCVVSGPTRDLSSLYASYLPQSAPGLKYTSGRDGRLTWTIKPATSDTGASDFQAPKGVVETDDKGLITKITVTQGEGFRQVARFSYPSQLSIKQLDAPACK